MDEYASDSCKDGVDQLMLSQRAMGNRGHYEPGSFFGTGHGCGSVSTRADFITPYIICTCVCVERGALRSLASCWQSVVGRFRWARRSKLPRDILASRV